MQHHQHHSFQSNYSLNTLRAAIDAQDDAILAALTGRQRFVDRVRAAKAAEGHLVYRPGREAKILRRLFAAADPSIDKNLINQMWREIFSSAIVLQEPLTIGVAEDAGYSGRELARQAFGHGVNLVSETMDKVITQLLAGEIHLAVLPYTPEAEKHIINTIAADESIHITNLLPFMNDGGAPMAYTIGRVCPEESGDDITLFADGDVIKMKDGFHLDTPGWLGVVPRPWCNLPDSEKQKDV